MTVVRIVALQAAWWATVLLAGARHDAWAVAPQLAFVVFAVALGPRRAGRAALAAASAALGVATDAALLAAGAMAFPASSWSPSSSSPLPPPFMIALWAAFGVALPSSLHLRARTLAAAAAVGAVAGPLAYRGGAAFDAIALAPGALPAIGVAWRSRSRFSCSSRACSPRRRSAARPRAARRPRDDARDTPAARDPPPATPRPRHPGRRPGIQAPWPSSPPPPPPRCC